MALEPCYLIYYQIVPLSSEPHAMSNKMNLCKLMAKRRRYWLPPSFLTASPLAPHNVLSISMTQKKNKRLLTVYYQILNFFSFFFQFSGQCFICTYSLIDSLSLHVYSLISCLCFILYRCQLCHRNNVSNNRQKSYLSTSWRAPRYVIYRVM